LYLGALAGLNGGTIANCYATGSVTGEESSYSFGGLCGKNTGTISNCYATANVTGADYSSYLGGLAGYNDKGTISNCYATGSVTGGRDSYELGGLCGKNRHGTISNGYSTGSVTGGEASIALGGLCGDNRYGEISDCYATGSVTGGGNSQYLGGLAGDNFWGSISNCFWDMETSGMTTSAGGTGFLTAQMQTLTTFTDAGWDFDTIWTIDEGLDYPWLWWEMLIGPVDLLIELSENIDTMSLQKDITNSLQVKLDTALRLLDDENEHNDVAAINSLQAFIDTVNAQRGKKISEEDADYLVTTALQIIDMLSSE